MARTPLKPGSPLTAATPLRAAAVGKSAPRDTIPPKVRKQVTARDPWCRRCGDPGHLHCHHRRPKQAGGDPRAHADCCCNLCRLCPACHVWVHAHRGEAETEGYLLPAETLLPGSVSVMVRSADGGASLWPSCSGVWLSEAPEVVTA
jgi:hypothetical protein